MRKYKIQVPIVELNNDDRNTLVIKWTTLSLMLNQI